MIHLYNVPQIHYFLGVPFDFFQLIQERKSYGILIKLFTFIIIFQKVLKTEASFWGGGGGGC